MGTEQHAVRPPPTKTHGETKPAGPIPTDRPEKIPYHYTQEKTFDCVKRVENEAHDQTKTSSLATLTPCLVRASWRLWPRTPRRLTRSSLTGASPALCAVRPASSARAHKNVKTTAVMRSFAHP